MKSRSDRRKSVVRPDNRSVRHLCELLECRRMFSGRAFVGPLPYADGSSAAAAKPIVFAASPYASVSNGTLTIDASSSEGAVTINDSGAVITVLANAGLLVFPDASVNNVVFAGTAGNDTLSLGSTLTKPLLLNGGAGSDTFNVNGGTFNTAVDMGATSQNLTVNVGNGIVAANIVFASSQHLAALNIVSAATATVATNGERVLVTPSLSITGTGKLDLTSNALIVRGDSVGTWNGTTYTLISGLIRSGRNGGSWNGSGIVTSEQPALTGNFTTLGITTGAQANNIPATGTATWSGESVSGTDTLVRYTFGGDANLDRKINVDDYTRIDFNVPLGTHGWYNGDFNYDGKINVDDYTIIDFNIGIQSRVLANTGFEQPQFSTAFVNAFDPTVIGNLRGQDPSNGIWRESTTDPNGSEGALTGTAVVENKAGGSGQDLQDVKVTRTQYDDRWSPALSYLQNALNPVVHIKWSMKVMQTTTDPNKLGPFFGIEAFDRINGPTLRIGGLGVDASTGEVLFEDPVQGVNITPVDTTVSFGVYNNFDMALDYRTHTYSISLNGQVLVSGINFISAGVVGLSDADISALQAAPTAGSNQDGVAYFDNYSVTAGLQ